MRGNLPGFEGGPTVAKRRLSMRKIREVLRLNHAAGMSVRAITRSVKASPSTVGEYIRRAEVQDLGWPLPGSLDDAELEHRLFPAPASTLAQRRRGRWPLAGGYACASTTIPVAHRR